jgi:hypothetical protein
MWLTGVRAMVREVLALSRNYRHAAILRRHVKAKYGAVVTARPTILVGEALAVRDHVPWKRLAALAVLLVVTVAVTR